eukprot:95946-Pyramimonas_sp.AAC.1
MLLDGPRRRKDAHVRAMPRKSIQQPPAPPREDGGASGSMDPRAQGRRGKRLPPPVLEESKCHGGVRTTESRHPEGEEA